MKIETKYFGQISVDQNKVIHFVTGLPGFDEEKEFVLLKLSGTSLEAFQMLQSIKTPGLAFVVTNPYYFYKDYEFRLNKTIKDLLKIEQQEDVLVLTIVTLKSPFDQSTINLKAPLIINLNRKLGKQYILNDENYPTKAPIHFSKAPMGKEKKDASSNP